MGWKNKGTWTNDDIVKYYRGNDKAYAMWGPDMHYGYWEKGVKTQRAAARRMNEKLIEKVGGITKDDYVLDAGCGVGGNAVWLAKTFGCKVVGVSIVPEQVETAKKRAKEAGVSDLCDFKLMDYMNFTFPDETFTVVMGLESICYADPKSEFIKGVWRILKKGGRFGMADGFAEIDVNSMQGNDKRVMHRWMDGWKLNNMETLDAWKSFANTAGFASADYVDVSKLVMPSAWIMVIISGILFWPLHLLDKIIELNDYPTDAMFHQFFVLKRRLMAYGIFWATK